MGDEPTSFDRLSGQPPHAERSRSSDHSDPAWTDRFREELVYEIETIPGLEEFTERELRQKLGRSAHVLGRPAEGRIALSSSGAIDRSNALRSAVAVHAVQTFAVPRPRALLGHQNLTRLMALIERATAGYPPETFATFRLSAAGADTGVFTRLKDEIGGATGLRSINGDADLLLAVRRPPGGRLGWQVLARLGPRPLSARPWRVCNLPGALNATVAHAMVALAGPTPSERFLNAACGSGTLMIERLAMGPARAVLGCDVDWPALECARANLRASGHTRQASLLTADATRLPFPDRAFETIVADLPFGMLVGSGARNEELYPGFVAEASRVAAPGAVLVVITTARRLFETAMDDVRDRWTLEKALPIKLSFQKGYLYPRIYVYRQQV